MAKPIKSEEELKSDFDSFVEKILPQAKLVALSELVGGNFLMKKEYKLNTHGDIVSEKYVMVPWENEEEVTRALNFLLDPENNPCELGDDYYIISQRAPSHRFWESLLARTIGKPIEQMKVEQNVNMYSETVANARNRMRSKESLKSDVNDWV
jgi:hypothetical protein